MSDRHRPELSLASHPTGARDATSRQDELETPPETASWDLTELVPEIPSVATEARSELSLEILEDLPSSVPLDLLESQAFLSADDESGGDRPESHQKPRSPRFEILGRFDAGNLGVIARALDHEFGREVALKGIRSDHADNPVTRHRFYLEALITGNLEHPGIVPTYGYGRWANGRPYYAMQLLRGKNLRDQLNDLYKNRRSLDPTDIKAIIRRVIQVCETVAYAHSRGVIHRDIKPSNIMTDRFSETYLVDWGLAQLFDLSRWPVPQSGDSTSPDSSGSKSESKTEHDGSTHSDPSTIRAIEAVTHAEIGRTVGTRGFVAPEFRAGQPDRMGPQGDIYALGAVLYCVLTGRSPARTTKKSRTSDGQPLETLPKPRAINPELPPALEAICLKAMNRDPSVRYDTAEALARDLENWLVDEPVTARPDPLEDKIRRWTRRHKALATALIAVVVTAITVSLSFNVLLAGMNKDLKAKIEQINLANDTKMNLNEELDNKVQKNDEFVFELLEQIRMSTKNNEDVYVLRDRLVEHALRQLSESDKSLQHVFEVGEFFREAGNAHRYLGHFDAAESAYRSGFHAIETYRDTSVRHEAVPLLGADSNLSCELADLFLSAGRVDEAEAVLRQTIERLDESLGDQIPVLNPDRCWLAQIRLRCLIVQAELDLQQNSPNRVFDRVPIELQRYADLLDQGGVSDSVPLIIGQHLLGRAYLSIDRLLEAEEHLDASSSLILREAGNLGSLESMDFETMTKDQAFLLGLAQLTLAECLEAQGRRDDEVTTAYNMSVQAMRQCVRDRPSSSIYSGRLAEILYRQAQYEAQAGHTGRETIRSQYRESLELLTPTSGSESSWSNSPRFQELRESIERSLEELDDEARFQKRVESLKQR